MAPLKSLEQEYPMIDSNFQTFCASHGIFSVEDFLIHDLNILATLADQQSTSQRLKQGITQILSIIDSKHQPWFNGLELMEDAQKNKHVLCTGCDGIDGLLGGGLRKGQLIEIVGPSSSGKTQVCLRAASNVAMKHLANVLYLDTGNSFSPQRILHFVGKSSDIGVDLEKQRMLEQVMNSIFCHTVFDIYSLFDVLYQLDFNLRTEKREGDRVQLLIIDSISSLITPILGGGSQGHALMVSAGFLLKKLAHEHNVAVLVTNHTVGGDRCSTKPALGESWKGVPHVRLELSREPGSNVGTAAIIKHSAMAAGKAARFRIADQHV